MTTLFDRRCVVTVGREPPNNFVQTVPDALRIEGLRTTFSLELDDKPEPNVATVAVYNLSADSRAQLQGKGFRLILAAGYAEETETIFSGDVRNFSTTRDGPDLVTKFEIGDGERAFRFARVSESFGHGTPFSAVLTKVIKAVASDPGNALQVAAGVAGQFSSGYVVHGRAAPELSKLLAPHGFQWSVQGGRLQILGEGEYTADEGPLVSSSTGMVGSPEAGAPDKKTGRFSLRVKSLLLPRMRPGQRFQIRAESHSGTWLAKKVKHVGDTHGGDWHTEIEAVPS